MAYTDPLQIPIAGRPHSNFNSSSPRFRTQEIVHVDHNATKEHPISSNASEAESNHSVPTLVPRSAPLFKSSGSTQEMTQGTEISRSLSSPSSSSNGLQSGKTPQPTTNLADDKSSEHYSAGMIKSASQNGVHQHQRGMIVGTTPGANITSQRAQRNTSPRATRTTYHQPKRQHAINQNAKHRAANRASVSDLIAVGTCKALYDFESEQYGETFISFKSGDELKLISSSSKWQGNPDTDGWIYAETIPSSNDPKALARRGFIPAAFVEISLFPEPQPLTLPRKSLLDDCTSPRGSHSNLRSDASFLSLGQATEL